MPETPYYPGPWPDWKRKKPEELGMREDKLEKAIEFSRQSESDAYRDLALNKVLALEEPYPTVIGPMRPRGDVTGVVVKNGYIVAEWGETNRVDMTFSCSKSYVNATAGLAWDRGMIRNINDKIGDYVMDGGYEGAHNSQITWHMSLNQTSDWAGNLWDKPDWCDRPEGPKSQWMNRPLKTPGEWWKYNDTRVNRLALSLTRLWRRPLPQVLHENIMKPMGASPTWEWHGYDNSWIKVDGVMVQAVSGGGHWGGGMFISAMDHARFGYLTLREGKWEDKQLLSKDWIKMCRTPTGTKRSPEWDPTHATKSIPAEYQACYGYMNYRVNKYQLLLPSCPENSFYHSGDGVNAVYVDYDNDLVVVVRWIKREALDGFLGKVLAAIEK